MQTVWREARREGETTETNNDANGLGKGLRDKGVFRKRSSARFSFASVSGAAVKDAAYYHERGNAIASEGKWQESKADYRETDAHRWETRRRKKKKLNRLIL